MKMIFFLLAAFLSMPVVVSAQEFDITGSYRGELGDMAVRIDVQEIDGDGYEFSFIAREEAGPVFSAAYSETGEYLFEENGDRLQVAFEGGLCRVNNGDQTFPLVKTSGDILSITGSYAFQVEEDAELSLVVEEAGFDEASFEDARIQYTFTFEVWETENILTGQVQQGNIFQLTSDWGETVKLEFTPEQCVFYGETEGTIVLSKQSSSL